MIDALQSDPQDSAAAAKLLSAVRSLRRWTWWFAGVLAGYIILWLAFLGFQSFSLITLASQRGSGEADPFLVGFLFSMVLGSVFLIVIVGLPTIFVAQGAKHAGRMIATGQVKHLIQAIIWLRRFLVVSTLWILLYLAIVALIFFVDLARVLP